MRLILIAGVDWGVQHITLAWHLSNLTVSKATILKSKNYFIVKPFKNSISVE